MFDFSWAFRGVNTNFFFNFADIFLISPTSDQSDFLLKRAVHIVYLHVQCNFVWVFFAKRTSISWNVHIEITSVYTKVETASPIGWAVIMYVETSKNMVIDIIGNVIMCLTSHCPIIFSIRVSWLILTVSLVELKGKMSKLSILNSKSIKLYRFVSASFLAYLVELN